jgi:hypothetical protein
VAAEDRLVEDVVDLVRGLVLVHGDLLEHDLALRVDVRERRGQEHLGQQVERLVRVRVEEAGVELRRLLAGGGVRRGAHAVEHLGDLDGRVPLGALEQQVLQEVRDARLSGRLVTRSCSHPQPEGNRAHGGDDLRDYSDARIELRYLCFRRGDD